MKKANQLLTMAFLLMTIMAYGQHDASNKQVQPYIEVRGTAEQEIIPDEIFISIVIREKFEGKTKITIEEQEEKLKQGLILIGIDIKDFSLADANADYIKVKWQRKEVLTKKDYLLKTANATIVGKVFQKLEELEILDAYISKVSHSKIDSLRKEVKIQAMRAAKEKADYLLNVIGQQTGQALVVTESFQNNTERSDEGMDLPRRNVSVISRVAPKEDSDTNLEIQFQKIKLTASIYVKFAIK